MTTHYRAPLRDYEFLLDELFLAPELGSARQVWRSHGDVLEPAARFCEEVLAPLYRTGDEEGCRFKDGEVFTPAGFRAAFTQFNANGWSGLTEGNDDGHEGGHIGSAAAFCFDETLGAANLAFSNYLGPTKRVAQAIQAHADQRTKRLYGDALHSGECGGTLCLTEPQCGTDLGLIRTRAKLEASSGEYLLSGTKIFVTSGEHDLTRNIIHLVLARIEGAQPGIKGLSLFLVPKLVDGGSTRNAVQCIGIEHKMGIRASATCTLELDRARGVLIGKPGEGMRSLFPIMERERLTIALQSIGLAEHAYQKARNYATVRLQGRSASGIKSPELPADPLVVHADVRRMLLTMRAYTEGTRALLIWIASQIDHARRESNAEARRDALDFVQLLTPLAKAFATDLGVETTRLGIQVMGGHGYIRESGMEQLARDAHVTPLYAGANGIQALDLVVRKLRARDGRMLDLFTTPVKAVMESWRAHPDAEEFTAPVLQGLEKLTVATKFLQEQGSRDPELAGAVGTAYLHLFGHVALAFLWSHAALIASKHPGADRAFYDAKIITAKFYLQHLYPVIEAHARSIAAGSKAVSGYVAEL